MCQALRGLNERKKGSVIQKVTSSSLVRVTKLSGSIGDRFFLCLTVCDISHIIRVSDVSGERIG